MTVNVSQVLDPQTGLTEDKAQERNPELRRVDPDKMPATQRTGIDRGMRSPQPAQQQEERKPLSVQEVLKEAQQTERPAWLPGKIDYRSDPESFDFQRRVGANNEEIRAKAQSWWDLGKGMAAASAGIVFGGTIENVGSMFDFPELVKRFQDSEREFESNWLSDAGHSLQKGLMDRYPTHQTERAQEGWAPFDATWYASRFPSIVSTLSLMAPVFAGRALVSGAGKATGATQALRKAGVLNKRREVALDTIGSSIMSRHMYSSLESRDVMESTIQRLMQEGITEEEAIKAAGLGASENYRLGWWNIWKDLASWHIIFRGVGHANRNLNRRLADLYNHPRATQAQRGIAETVRHYGRPTQAALQRQGLSKRDYLKIALGEGFEEFNIQFQKAHASRYGDIIAGLEEPEWEDEGFLKAYFSGRMLDHIKDPHTWDASLMGFLGGGVFAFVGQAANMRYTKGQQQREFNELSQEVRKTERVKELINASALAEAEGNMTVSQRIQDEMVFELSIAGLHEGSGKSFEGGLIQGRHEHNIQLAEAISNMSPEQLKNIGFSDEAISVAPDVAKRALQEMEAIEKDYNYYSDREYGVEHGDTIAVNLANQEFRLRQAKRVRDEYRQQTAEAESKISEIRDQLSPEQSNLLTAETKLSTAKESLKNLKDNPPYTEHKRGIAKKDASSAYEAQVSEYESQITELETEVANLRNQSKENLTPDQLKKQNNLRKQAKDIISTDKDTYTGESMANAEVQSIQAQLAKWKTPTWQKEFAKSVNQENKKRVDKIAIAAIETSTKPDHIKRMDLSKVSAEVKERAKQRLSETTELQKVLNELDQSAIENLTDIEKRDLIDDIDASTTEADFEKFLNDHVRGRQNAEDVEAYARERFEKAREMETEFSARRMDQDVEATQDLSEKERRQMKNKIDNISNRGELDKFIKDHVETKDISPERKKRIIDYINHRKAEISRLATKNERQRADKAAKDKEAQRAQHAKDVDSGKAEVIPEDTSQREEVPTPKDQTPTGDTISGNIAVGSNVGYKADIYWVGSSNADGTVDLVKIVGPSLRVTPGVKVNELTFVNNNAIVTEYEGVNYLVLADRRVVDLNKKELITGPDNVKKRTAIVDYANNMTEARKKEPAKEAEDVTEQPPEPQPNIEPSNNTVVRKANESIREAGKPLISETSDGIFMEKNKSYQPMLNGEPLALDPTLLADPNINVGTEVEFELIETDWWTTKDPTLNEIPKVAYQGREHEQIPIYVKVGDQRVSVLKAGDPGRKYIYDELIKGNRVTSNITRKISSSENFNNTRILNSETNQTETRFFNPAEHHKIRWIRNEQGDIVKSDNVKPTYVTTYGSIHSQSSTRTPVHPEAGPQTTTLPASEVEALNQDIYSADWVSQGHVYEAVLSPDGKYKPAKTSVANLHEPIVNKVIELLKEGNANDAEHLVTLSSPIEQFNSSPETHLRITQSDTGEITGASFYSPTLKQVVDVGAKGFALGIQGEIARFDIITEVVRGEGGKPDITKRPATTVESEMITIESELQALLPTLKRQVLRENLNNDQPYTSRMNPENRYENYNDYLNSEQEGFDPNPKNSQAIVRTDILNNNGSLFHDIGIDMDNASIAESTTRQKQDEVAERYDATVTPEKIPTKKRLVRREKRRRSDSIPKRLEKLYQDNRLKLEEKNVSLQEFMDSFKGSEQFITPEQHVEAYLNEEANRKEC